VAEEAERLLRSKDRLVAVLGHDLRTPLSAMRVGCQVLGSASDLTERQRSTVARLGRSVERMSRMVADILDFARTAVGATFPLHLRPTNLAEVLSVVVDEIRWAHPDRSIDLSIADDLQVTCDPDRIAQAVSNLVVNAVEHGEGAVRISAGPRGDQIVVEVHNAGPAIPAEAVPALFDPFAPRAKHAAGLGIGLYIVNDIVRGHAGAVQVHSSPEHGTSFEMHWPRSLVDERHSPAQGAEPAGSSGAVNTLGARNA
jgi:signal transduction histidine kinase